MASSHLLGGAPGRWCDIIPLMNLLAEVSDKIGVSTSSVWVFMGVVSAAVGVIAFASRSWGAMFLAVPISALGCVLILSFLDDPVFGDAVLQELGWAWFATNLAASLLPVATVAVVVASRRRLQEGGAGFEVVQSGRATAGQPPPAMDHPGAIVPEMRNAAGAKVSIER